MDNLVQESCQLEYKKSKFHKRNFELYLAFIEIKPDVAVLRSYGSRVNIEWNAVFKEDENGHWDKVSF